MKMTPLLFFMPMLLAADAATAQTDFRRFVTCPIYRDTDAGRKSGCWLGTQVETSQRFDVSNSPDKPLVGRQMLVEGVVSNEKDICGGTVLQPVRISVLQERYPDTEFAAVTQTDILGTLGTILGLLTLVLAAIAAISLVVMIFGAGILGEAATCV